MVPKTNILIALIKHTLQQHSLCILPILFFLAYLPFASVIDQKTASFFLGSAIQFTPDTYALLIYKYGLIPGQLLFASATILFAISFSSKKWTSFRFPSLYIMLTLLTGSLLISNIILKQHWPRPRPKQVYLYGGRYPYCPIFTKYTGPIDRPLRSLPCGHATMGFCFFSFFFIGKRYKNKTIANTGLLTGTFLSLLISYARLAQGGHFVSDIVLAFLIMWLTGYFFSRKLLNRQRI